MLGALLSAAAATADPVTEVLPNGITVIVDAVPEGDLAAIVIQVAAGEIHDPPGVSGMAHLVEHLMVTAASSEQPALTAEAFHRRYAGQATAQTARDFTLYAGFFPVAEGRTATEIAWWADRFGTLEITTTDLARELPRIDAELTNMRTWPHLAAPNFGQDAADPLPPGHRKGGVIEQLRPVTPADADAWRRAHYRGAALTVSIAGAVDPKSMLATVREHFGALTFDETPVAPPPAVEPAAEPEPITIEVAQGRVDGTPYVASRTLRTPDLDDPAYPAFVLFMNRLFMRSSFTRDPSTPHQPVQWQMLDNPRVWTVQRPVDVPGDAGDALDQLLAHVATPPPTAGEVTTALGRLGMMLGITPPPPGQTAANPYTTAFINARCHDTRLVRQRLAARMRAVDDAAWAHFRDEVLPNLPAADVLVVHPTP